MTTRLDGHIAIISGGWGDIAAVFPGFAFGIWLECNRLS